MGQISRYERGKKNIAPSSLRAGDAVKVPWTNPLKGDEKKVAMAEVTMKRMGLNVGFRFRF